MYLHRLCSNRQNTVFRNEPCKYRCVPEAGFALTRNRESYVETEYPGSVVHLIGACERHTSENCKRPKVPSGLSMGSRPVRYSITTGRNGFSKQYWRVLLHNTMLVAYALKHVQTTPSTRNLTQINHFANPAVFVRRCFDTLVLEYPHA